MGLKVRLATPRDLRFVHSAWWSEELSHTVIPKTVYKLRQDEHINRLMSRSETLVAFFEEAPDEVLSCSVVEAGACHFLYTKMPYRNKGIASGLVKDRCVFYTTWLGTRANRFAERRGMLFNPYLQRES